MQDRETFIAFLHIIFPPKMLEEVLLPDDEYGLYDVDHLKSFYTLVSSQAESENLLMLETMKEEKTILCQKIQDYEKQLKESD